MAFPRVIVATLLLPALLSSCGGSGAKEWKPVGEAPLETARDECQVQIDDQMRLRGYPRRPSPETPQASYRQEIFTACMRGKGYEQK